MNNDTLDSSDEIFTSFMQPSILGVDNRPRDPVYTSEFVRRLSICEVDSTRVQYTPPPARKQIRILKKELVINENSMRQHLPIVESESSGNNSSFAESAEKLKLKPKVVLKPGWENKTSQPPPQQDAAGFQPATLTKGQKKAARKARQKEDKKNKQLEMKKLKFGEDFIDPDVDPEYNEIYGPPKPLHTQ